MGGGPAFSAEVPDTVGQNYLRENPQGFQNIARN